MNTTLHARLFSGLLVLALGMPATAAAREADFDLSASAGYQYDSNVNIAEIDENTGEGDAAIVLDLAVDGSLPLARRLTLDLGYGFSSTVYRDFSEFDLALHHLRGELGYRFAGFDSALSLDRFAARLNGDRFLDITRVSPSLSRMFGDHFYLRGAYARSEKSYDERTMRDAVNDAVRADAYFLIDGMQRYFALTLQKDAEDAVTNDFDYDGTRAQFAYGHRFENGPLVFDVKAHAQIEHRDYAAIPESAEAPRRDERFRSGLSVAMPLSEHFELRGAFEYADNDSSLAAARFDETVATVNVAAAF